MLNETQRRALQDTLRVAVDSVINLRLLNWLDRVITPLEIGLPEVMIAFNRGYLDAIRDAINIPPAIREAWLVFADHIQRNDPHLPEGLLENLQTHPNYNPFCLAEIQRFSLETQELEADGHLMLMRLREIYLEMTPMHDYRYGMNYHEFHFRIGNVPCNLDNFGPTPLAGEIQSDVTAYIEERIDIEAGHQETLAVLEEQRVALERQHQAALVTLEEQRAIIEQHDAPAGALGRLNIDGDEELAYLCLADLAASTATAAAQRGVFAHPLIVPGTRAAVLPLAP